MGQHTTLTAADGHSLAAYTAGLADAPRALVVVQEIFGVNHHIRTVCDGFADAGFHVVAPAMFDRAESGVELAYDEAGVQRGLALRARIEPARSIADLTAAAAFLGRDRVGIIGYCWGGSLAWWGATRTRLFAAAVGWYGGDTVNTAGETPNCPVQLHFGADDQSIPLEKVERFRAQRPEVEVFVYEGAGHGFGCDERGSHDAAATAQAQERTLAFLQRHL